MGYWCGVSDTAGRMYQMASPSASDQMREIGHSLQVATGGTDILALNQVNFN